ncbi:hypothetical protein ACJMK2_010244 [Sinanodonta woodiana]|uniref:3-dehydrosphinganine reductase n=1 Tax=Sinanodonta woodiana TaxID=1069815 RepID=A0ABD3VEQ4_SINWO
MLDITIKCHTTDIVITGGSSGIGKALAIEFVKKGASVTIAARDQEKLKEAETEIKAFIKDAENQKVHWVAMDVSKDYMDVERSINKAESQLGPISILVNCAGTSISGTFEDLPVEKFQQMMQINYLGSVYPTRAVVKSMKSRRQGRIVFVSSQAGQLGVYGYTAYSPSKYALRGLAESLQMEVKPYNIYVTVAFPPDTDTPGFTNEQIGKPKETQLISQSSGFFKAESVAKSVMEDTLNGRFLCSVGLDGWMLRCLTCGMTPITSALDGIQQVFLMGVFRLVSAFYLVSFDRIVQQCHRERKQKEKSS